MSKFAQRKLDWSDLQFVLSVLRNGSIAAAAKELGVNRSTVLRRIGSLETSLDFQVFDRNGVRYELAPGAGPLLEGALALEQTIDDLQRQIQGKEIRLEGTVTLTTTDSILVAILAPHLASFRDRHPNIQTDLLVSNHQLSLRRRDADIAVRPGMSPPENLSCRLLGPMHFGLYGRKGAATIKTGLNQHPWLGMESPLAESPPGLWFTSHIDDDAIVCRADSFVALRALAEAGHGLTLLPTTLGDQSQRLERVFPEHPEVSNKLWVVTHPDLDRSARVSALVEHLCAEVRMEPGRRPDQESWPE